MSVGPFKTEAEVRKLPQVRAVYAAFDADPGVGRMSAPNLAMLVQACEVAGVELGEFDRRIAEWLADWEPSTVAVVCGMIRRAASGRSS